MVKRGFTLVEMTIVIGIISVLAMLGVSVYMGAYQHVRFLRSAAIVRRAGQFTDGIWTGYETKPLKIKVPAGLDPAEMTTLKAAAVAEFQRLELPETIAEVLVDPSFIPTSKGPVTITRPAVSKRYKAQAVATWTPEYEEAECLYLILSAIRDNGDNALDQFSAGETGDTDGDGMRELLDSWKRPIKLSRRVDGVLVYSAGVDKLDAVDDITNYSDY